ncbi:helix-turn-helix domain-containing protein [Lutibacter flavus]|uniref:TolB amino-terminal domain-containing protein n=1 Tax=Lutibacter flavus TaxID=691689 RepID=A0A238YYP3_9FLAO|nr:helix-turn-helix domain-containing protein [Lutibacter flavus]SNR75639.1 TolB amino-terminal domain-containing protein [Lutibacter flavus]
MSDLQSTENDFLNKLTQIIEDNISNEQFGVSELAAKIGMSRSNLLRKIKKLNNLSVSQFIRQVRLKNAMDLLKENSFTVSEVSYKVGFGSTSYFIKCFKDQYGYPPGEVGTKNLSETNSIQIKKPNKKRTAIIVTSAIFVFVLFAFLFNIFKPNTSKKTTTKKSIAVLPFKNDSNDSTNVYFINGVMESILTNLQKIENLKVISRTSVEKYRNSSKTIPELAKELNVSYFVEGSGQKIGDKILLNIQLIEASSDNHLWAEQYNKKVTDIFKLQNDVAKNIADKIEVIITPEEKERIEKLPTNNPVAYDYFLKGLDQLHKETTEGLLKAIPYFEQAIAHDTKFTRAYANIAIAYYYLDLFQSEKKHSALVNEYTEKAMLLDPKHPESLIAKALSYMNIAEFKMAVPYFEKALEYSPNSAYIINTLSDFYTSYVPNTQKYLEYALKGAQLDIAANDSITASYIYLHISNAFIQTGFIEEAIININKSIDYNPKNIFSEYVKAYILFAKNKDLQQTKELLIQEFQKDTTRLDLMQEIGKIYYYMRDYKNSYTYYNKFTTIRETQKLGIYKHENSKIGYVYAKMGEQAKAEELFNSYFEYATNDESIYKNLSLAVYYAYKNDQKKSIEHLKLFAKEDNFQYWVLLFFKMEPLIDNIKDLPEFNEVYNTLETKFWENHKSIRKSLEEKDLLN